MKKILIIMSLSLGLWANSVYVKTYDKPMTEVYTKLLSSFDSAHLVVVTEINILEKFKGAGLPEKFGKNFNTNNLTGIKAIIACNGWFGNEVANTDPKMMGFCPIRVTVVEQEGKTSVLFVRSSVAPKESPAYAILEKLESKVIAAIDAVK